MPQSATAGGLTLSAEAPAEIPLAESQTQRFGVGLLPSVAVLGPVLDGVYAGLRVRLGALADQAQMNPTLREVGIGGVVSGAVVLRTRPGTWLGRPALGAWLETNAGVAITGLHLRPAYELALGWRFKSGRFSAGTSARDLYIHGIDPSLDPRAAHLVLIGLDVAFDYSGPHSSVRTPVPSHYKLAKTPANANSRRRYALDHERLVDSERSCAPMLSGAQDSCAPPKQPALGLLPVVQLTRIVILNHVLFDDNRARVKRAGKRTLRLLSAGWNSNPTWISIRVEGHADQRGPETFNLWLSQERARRVRRALIELGIPARKLTSRGLGSSVPRVAGSSRAALARNRRVEFVIYSAPEPRGD